MNFWKKLAQKYLEDAGYRIEVDTMAAAGDKVAAAVVATAKGGVTGNVEAIV